MVDFTLRKIRSIFQRLNYFIFLYFKQTPLTEQILAKAILTLLTIQSNMHCNTTFTLFTNVNIMLHTYLADVFNYD